MSVTLDGKPATTQQRGVEATRLLRQVLGLDDLKLLAIALAEVAANEAKSNPAFADRIRVTYDDLVQLKVASRSRTSRTPKREVKLIPIGKVEGARFDPHAPLDPHFLLQLYGSHQLHDALDGYSLATLKVAAARIQEEHPGTKPKSKASKAALIDYIVEHIAGPGH